VPHALYEGALFAQFARTCDTARGVVPLADHGHGELALGAARVSFEQAVAAHWMAIEPDPRAAQYERFMAWEDTQIIELYTTLGIPIPKPAEEVRATLERKAALVADFKDPRRGWTQRWLHEQCRDVVAYWKERDAPEAVTRLKRFQVLATKLANRGAHAGPRDAADRLSVGGGFIAQLGPSGRTPVYSALALQLAAWSFGCMFYLLARDVRAGDADEWHAFFWPLVVKCGEFTGLAA
jgi:hypothetical protein